ncbi:MAG: hypothetical protein F4Y28_15895 [Acidimicrobiia bacterium]|nr:hypothetical protein [Acidimicrobiia bacterium]MYG59600.1 hypothetical protein [Acidimicrobiia bacterium]MYJ31014.1 hypothetical protein [Acidimicrobiia bacterium]
MGRTRLCCPGAGAPPRLLCQSQPGGPVTYPFDVNGDGVADICSLPYTRREAIARQNALEKAFSDHPQFEAALALACAALGTLDFGDHPDDLAVDSCNPPEDPPNWVSPFLLRLRNRLLRRQSSHSPM